VFAALAQTQAECGQLVEGGRLRAAQIRARDAAEVESLLATVAARASAARASACAAAQAAAADVGAHEDRRTQEEVARLRDRADRLLPQLQSEVAASVRALLGPQPPGDLAAEAAEATP
jgi:hypothetical protein